MKHSMRITAVAALLLATGCESAQPWAGQTFAQGTSQAPDPLSAGLSSEPGLVNTLVNQLSIDSQQALGGVGSIFALAQQRMKPGDFMQLSSSVPGMDRYLSSVPQPAASNSWLSSTAELMDEKPSDLGGLTPLTGSFQTLGMDAKMISQFVPVVLQYVQVQSGPDAMSLLRSALY